MLQLINIEKKYTTGDLTQAALNGVSLNLRDSEFVAILGPSGSGKTTLLNIIGGLDRYDSGELIINGISTRRYTDRDWDSYRNHTVGFVFQSYNLIPHQTVLANVELALTISGVSGAERRRRAAEALRQVGLGDQLHKRPTEMSGGQMQRWPSPAPSSTTPTSCWPTSPPVHWTVKPASRSWSCSRRWPGTVWWSWSPITRSWPSATPPAS